MADTTFDAPPELEGEHCLGKFRRHPVEFFVIVIPMPPGTPVTYRVECDDGVGPHEVCRFSDATEEPVIWRGSWQGDEWCSWILGRARALVADPSRFDF
ncbi:hypothetical protein [Glycomyces tritici]|uniref:Uncharacterized protein n=1 Tax=Glycomyces tritici TaxID=2665176 RepID=A0ABT7YLT9_9ACTN|nr:hypothetical protein [Glycomyces tritici]MDN3239587.1 hypothetical protein [Glycomyces tritici]